MLNQQQVEKELKEYGQEHIIEWIGKLKDTEKEELIEQISDIDLSEITTLYQNIKSDSNKINQHQITPIDYVDKNKMSDKDRSELKKIGEQIIKDNQYAIVTMAGGQGTRLGFNGPKGTFKLDIGSNGKYIFEILAENIEKSRKLYGILPFWYIMTSQKNNKQTIDFFELHNYFGYDKQKVKFFEQGEIPMLTEDGKLVIENNKIKTASNGNGGVYLAMKKEGIIDDMKKKNVKWVYISGVDNIMVNPIDPIFIGLTIKQKMPIASKSVAKAYPEERVGVFCRRNGKPSTVEYIELSEKMRIECNEWGELIYGEANIISHLLNIEAIDKISSQNLRYHLAIKNNLYKFETFVFDGFEYLNDMLVMRVKRNEEFAPIKNKQGIDSPETAKEIYEKNLNANH